MIFYFLFEIPKVYKLYIFYLLLSLSDFHSVQIVYLWVVIFSYRTTLCMSCISLTYYFLLQIHTVYKLYIFDLLLSLSDSDCVWVIFLWYVNFFFRFPLCKICIFLPSYFLLQITIVYESYIFDLLLTLSDSKSLKNCISLTWYFLFQILIVYRLYIIDWMLSFSDSLCV